MKNILLSSAFVLTALLAKPAAASSFGSPVENAPAASVTLTNVSANSPEAALVVEGTEAVEYPAQEKPRKAKKKKEKEEQDKTDNGKQEVKEVATAKRQDKPEKVSADGEPVVIERAGRPQSAARPGRGAANGAVKAAGKAAGNAVKIAKPVKVGGVGVGRIKVGKN